MTVSSTTVSIEYNGNSANKTFPVTFPFWELEVSEITVATGTQTAKTEGTHYTVTGGSGATGTVTFITAPATGQKVLVRRATTTTQLADYVENDPFPAETHENAHDRRAMVTQELTEEVGRALKIPESSSISAHYHAGGKKIAGLANGTAGTDAATYGQLLSASSIVTVAETWINAKTRGVVFTDSSTYATANSNIMDTLIGEGGCIWFDSGDPWFARRMDFSNYALNIRGKGTGDTKLHFQDPGGSSTGTDCTGIYSSWDHRDVTQALIRDLTIEAEYDSNARDGTAIYIEGVDVTGRGDSPYIVNVWIKGTTGGTNQICWNNGVNLRGFGSPKMDYVQIALKENVSEAGFIFEDSTNARPTINPLLQNCNVLGTKYGAKLLGQNEGGRFMGCSFQEVNWGILKDHGATGPAQPGCYVINTHINSNQGGIWLKNGRNLWVDACYFAAKTDAALPSGFTRTDYYFLKMDGLASGLSYDPELQYANTLRHTMMKANNVDVFATGHVYGIKANNSHNGYVDGCTFISCSKPISLTSTCENWLVTPTNQAYIHINDTGHPYVHPDDFSTDLGTNNLISSGYTATGVSLVEAADAGTARGAIRAPRDAWTTLEIITVGTGTSCTSAQIVVDADNGYGELGIVCVGVSHNGGGTDYLTLEYSYNNGSTWSTPIIISNTIAAASRIGGLIAVIENFDRANDEKHAFAVGTVVSTGNSWSTDSTVDTIDKIRIAWGGGGSFDNGNISLMIR